MCTWKTYAGTFTRAAFLLLITRIEPASNEFVEIPHQEVENWAWRFGRHLYELSKKITYVDEISSRYASAKLDRINGTNLVNEMVSDIEKLMDWKIQAVQRIADTAEQAVKGHEYKEDLKFDYFNAKGLDESRLPLTPNKRFDNIPISVNHSTVHVATNVYDGNPEVLNAIKSSEILDPIFMGNYRNDPKSLWQYFGSSKGFLRHYPGLKWPDQEDQADMYDCRMRPWYIEAAASPKDIIILLDISGSMTGVRYEIARHVVMNILETLNHNDFVAVFKFSNNVENVVECFGDRLVPAYRENLELIKESINKIKLENMSDFTEALTVAFNILQEYNHSGEGGQCNQAIMIVADGAPFTYEEVFQKLNQPNQPVRVFTYLIGREVTEFREMRWMACENRGYFTHVTTTAEVREQVEKYIPVMARPLAIQQSHSYIWTPVYADIADPKVARWLFETRERKKRKQRLLRKMHLFQLYGDEVFQAEENEMQASSQEAGLGDDLWSDEELNNNQDIKKEMYDSMEQYQLMTTVAVPVFNQVNVQITEKIITNGTVTEQIKETKRAELLGVAGTDLPVKQILKLAPPYKVGVNGYPFIITNNGQLLTHPDLRPLYNGLLKVGYSNVDLSDVELGDINFPPWERDPKIMALRKDMIDRKHNSTKANVKIHFDNMKRVITRQNTYFYAPIKKTPFVFGLALPDRYGMYRVRASTEIKSANYNVFEGNKWRVHPDWVYCEYLYAANHPERSPEANLINFLNHIQGHKREFAKEKMQRVKDPLPWEVKYPVDQQDETRAKDEYYCDRELLHNLIFDATATNVFGKKRSLPLDAQGRNNAGFARKNGVTITFVATRSGLTRWEDLLLEEELGNMSDPHFIYMHNRAIDEVWYKRAVDQHFINNATFVFSVPFEAYRKNDTYVTGSHAIFVESGSARAPAAVVGLQFKHSTFTETFLNFTSNCQSRHCNVNCSSDELNCYLLDDSGFVIVSENYRDTGKFFGEVDGLIMHSLIVDGVYQGVNMYDFQGSCIEDDNISNAASYLLTPLKYLASTVNWLFAKLILLWMQYDLYSWWDLSWLAAWASNVEDSNELHRHMDQEESRPRRLKPCSMNFTLYRLNISQQKMKPLKAKLIKCNPNGCDRPFSVQQVPYTNMILLAVDATCPCDSTTNTTIVPKRMNNDSLPCQLLNLGLYRKHPTNKCFNYHPEEMNIKECGRGCEVRCTFAILVAALITLMLRHWTCVPADSWS